MILAQILLGGECQIDAEAIIKFEKENTDDVRPYVDFDKGWKFTEDDKAFLIDYCKGFPDALRLIEDSILDTEKEIVISRQEPFTESTEKQLLNALKSIDGTLKHIERLLENKEDKFIPTMGDSKRNACFAKGKSALNSHA